MFRRTLPVLVALLAVAAPARPDDRTCFECHQVRVTAGGKDQLVYVSRSPAAAFDAVLRKAGVALPPGAEGK